MPVLVVDDNATTRRTVASLLDELGFRPQAEPEGLAALAEVVRAEAAGEPYGLVLTDVTMPGMDGLTLADHLNKELTTPPSVIFLVTSADRQAVLGRCKDGASAYVFKPVKRSDLVKAVGKLFGAGSSNHDIDLFPEEADAPKSAAAGGRSLRVLLVDDNPFNQKVGALKLEKGGCAVQVAGSGREAIQALAECAFDAIFLDMQMPDMDGLEVAAAIREREQPGGRRVPIIAMTAHTREGMRERCLEGGMDGYVAKPIKDDELWREVDRVLPARVTPPVPLPVQAPAPDAPFFLDQDAVLGRVGGSLDLLRQLVEVFRNDCAELLPALRRGVEGGDAAAVCNAAHTLKGMVAFFGAEKVRESAYRLERMGEAGDLADALRELPRLAEEVSALQAVLDAFCGEAV